MRKWFSSWLQFRLFKSALKKASGFEIGTKKAIASDLLQTMSSVENNHVRGLIAHQQRAREALEKALNDRHSVLLFSMHASEDPAWYAAAMRESWAGGRLAHLENRLPRSQFDRIDRAAWEFVTSNLSIPELAKQLEEQGT